MIWSCLKESEDNPGCVITRKPKWGFPHINCCSGFFPPSSDAATFSCRTQQAAEIHMSNYCPAAKDSCWRWFVTRGRQFLMTERHTDVWLLAWGGVILTAGSNDTVEGGLGTKRGEVGALYHMIWPPSDALTNEWHIYIGEERKGITYLPIMFEFIKGAGDNASWDTNGLSFKWSP